MPHLRTILEAEGLRVASVSSGSLKRKLFALLKNEGPPQKTKWHVVAPFKGSGVNAFVQIRVTDPDPRRFQRQYPQIQVSDDTTVKNEFLLRNLAGKLQNTLRFREADVEVSVDTRRHGVLVEVTPW